MKTENQALIPVTERPINAETPHAALLTELTPTELFYVRNHFDVPQASHVGWLLEVDGAVGQPLRFSLEEIRGLPARELLVALECAGNGRSSLKPPASGTPWDLGAVSQARFRGTALSNLLGQLEIAEDALEVLFTGADQGQVRTGQKLPYARSLPLEVALHPDTLLVWEMNGSELTPQHGYPLRLVVPGWYGMASVKWLRHISLLTEPFEGFFQREEYVYVGEVGLQDGAPVTHMRVRSLILSPAPGSVIAPGEIRVQGIAWSGAGQVEVVELSFDQGRSWEVTDLHAPTSDYGVQRWFYDWQPPAGGKYTLIARARDASGSTQPLAPRWNVGGYGNNNAHQVSLTIR